jgi:hypothetical protein
MAYRASVVWLWVQPTQRSFSRCPMSEIWMASSTSSLPLRLWSEVYNRAFLKLLTRRLSLNPTQRDKRYYCWIFDGGTVCYGVGVEPGLQHVTDEAFSYRSANREHGARLDVVAESFFLDRQRAFFDVRVFNPFAPSYRNTSLSQCYRKNELEKRRAYDERIREVEHGSFSPLVFSTAGGMGATANVVYKRIASLIAEKHGKPYSKTINWLRCRLSFSLLRSAIMCLQGSRSSHHNPINSFGGEIELALVEGRVSCWTKFKL